MREESPSNGSSHPGQRQQYYDCPHCMSRISTMIDMTAGRHQSFTEDCEVCCRPIAIHVALRHEEIVGFAAEPES
jgi:hypothetical protein